MEGSRRHRQPTVSLHREFAGSRLEEQILVRAFELVLPSLRRDLPTREGTDLDADKPPLNPVQSQGA